MFYPLETTTWTAEIHSLTHRQEAMRLAQQERLLRSTGKRSNWIRRLSGILSDALNRKEARGKQAVDPRTRISAEIS